MKAFAGRTKHFLFGTLPSSVPTVSKIARLSWWGWMPAIIGTGDSPSKEDE